jgi:hypothetical protein
MTLSFSLSGFLPFIQVGSYNHLKEQNHPSFTLGANLDAANASPKYQSERCLELPFLFLCLIIVFIKSGAREDVSIEILPFFH